MIVQNYVPLCHKTHPVPMISSIENDVSKICSCLLSEYLLIYLLHGAESFLRSKQDIPRILRNPKIHYRIHKCPQPAPILSQLDPVHTPTFNFLKIHLNIFLPSKPGSPQWSLSLRFSHPNPVYASPLPHTGYIPRPPHYFAFYQRNNTGRGVQIIKHCENIT